MKFIIGQTSYFTSIGFDTTHWRKSVDGTKVIVHDCFVKVLIPNVEGDINLTVYSCPSTQLDTVLNSMEWNNTKI